MAENEIPTPPTRQELLLKDDNYVEPKGTPGQAPLPLGPTQDLQHSGVMGGSSAFQRINCPGSYMLEKDLPKGPASDYATQGSVFHAAMEMMLAALDPDADTYEADLEKCYADMVGQNFEFGDEWAITEDQVEHKIKPAWDAFMRVLNEYDLDDWFIEQRVSLDTVIPGAFGTIDLLAIDTKKRLHVLDWKFGDGVFVPVEGNYQATFYAAGALYDEDPEVKEFCQEVSGIVLHVVQPRMGYDEDPLQSWETDEAYIEKFIDLAIAAVDAAVKPNPPFKAGDHCRWCAGKQPSKAHGGKPACPAHREGLVEALKHVDTDLITVDLADAMRVATLLKEWTAQVFAFAQEQLEQGAQIPGYKLVRKKSAGRRYTDAAEAERVLKKKKVKVATMYEDRKLRSPTQLEKADPAAYAMVENLVHSPSSGVTVVPDTDKRPAVVDSFALLSEALPEQKQ